MKIAVINVDGFASPLALRLRDEGNEVRMFTKVPEAREIYKGILDSESDWKPLLDWCDYGVFFSNGLADIWEEWVKKKPAFGGSRAGHEAEKNRTEAHKRMKSLGIKCPESLTFKTVNEAVDHLKKHKVRHFVKPTGGKTDSDDVHGSEFGDNRDAIAILKRMEDRKTPFDSIEVEESIDGIEAGVAGYFDGKKFGEGIEVNFQMKPFATGNNGEGIGFKTGEMGTLCRMVDQDNAFFKRTLGRMTDYLRSINYRGEWDCGFIVNEKGDYFIEDTPRKGVPDFVIRWETQVTPEGYLYWQIATGNLKDYRYLKEWACGVVMVSPGFPDTKSSEKRSVGLPIYGWQANYPHCHLFEARKALGVGGVEISKGGYGYPLVVTGRGGDPGASIRKTYDILSENNKNRVFVPKAWYRSDIGQRVINQRDKIIELGILTEEDFDGTKNNELNLLLS